MPEKKPGYMLPITGRSPVVYVTYDSGQSRVTKRFEHMNQAKPFYIQKFNAGCNPKIEKEEPHVAPPNY